MQHRYYYYIIHCEKYPLKLLCVLIMTYLELIFTMHIIIFLSLCYKGNKNLLSGDNNNTTINK